MLILFWDHKASSRQSTNPQHSITSQSWFYSVIQQTSKLTDIHHSHFNDKVQLHASHCIIQTLLFHSRHKITQADRERERAESGVIWISVYLLTHAHPKLIKPRNRGASPLLQTSGDNGAEQSQTRWRAGLWGGERIRKHSLLLDWAPWGHGSPSLPRVSECTMCCMHKRMKYMCNLFTEAKPPPNSLCIIIQHYRPHTWWSWRLGKVRPADRSSTQRSFKTALICILYASEDLRHLLVFANYH